MIIRGLDGRIIPPGRVRREMTESFLGASALPSWLNVSGNSATAPQFLIPPQPQSYKLNASPGTQARLRTAFDIDASKVEEIGITIESLTWSNTAQLLAMEIFGTNLGVSFRHLTGTTLGYIRQEGATPVDTTVPFRLQGDIIPFQRRNVTFAWRPKQKLVYIAEDDQILVVLDVPSATLGNVRPSFSVLSTDGNTAYMQCGQVKVHIIHN